MRIVALSLAALVVLGSPGLAQAPTDRFQIEETSEGVLRLDRVTGAVDVCRLGDAGWDCESVVPAAAEPARDPTDTSAWRNLTAENARLKEEVARLERRLAMIAALVEGADAEGAEAAGDDEDLTAAARREIDRAVDITDYAVRRFGELFRSLGEDTAGR